MIRVLHVLGGLGTGGTESLIMNWYRHIDRTKVQFDFLVRSNDNNYVEEIQALGGRILYTAPFPRHFLQNRRETEEILKRKEWDVVHVHGNAAMYMLPLKLAKRYGYQCRAMHSHSVKAQNSMFKIVHAVNKVQIPKYATHRIACSLMAGRWMYGSSSFTTMRNAVDASKCQYDGEARNRIRDELKIENKYVVGHVGRFVIAKNHIFLLEAFKDLLAKRPDAVLMLIGDGELENDVKAKAAQMGILESVLFMGRISDVGKLMSAMDVFVLPSLYEGLGIVLVEAQFSGLPCIVSEEAYNEEVQITQNLTKIPLDSGAAAWADYVYQIGQKTTDRYVSENFAVQSGYDMRTEAAKLEAFYIEAAKGNNLE